MNEATPRRYRFGDSSQPGVLLGLSVSQAVPVISGILWLALCLQTPLPMSPVVGLIGTAAGLVVAFGRWRGAPITEILVPTIDLWARRPRRRRWHRPVAATRGAAVLPEPLPPVLAGVEIIELPESEEPMGAAHDRRAGTLTAVLQVSGDGFPLAPTDEQDTMLDTWGTSLSPFARQGCPVTRVAWHHWSRPLTPSIAPGAGQRTEAEADHAALVDQQATVSMTHDVLITVTVDQRRVVARSRGSRQDAALAALADEVERFRSRLAAAELSAGRPLSRVQMARAIRERSDPSCSAQLAVLHRSLATAAGRVLPTPIEWGPMTVEAAWHHVRVDGACHRTYRIAAWPPLPVPPDWLGALVTEPGVTRTVTVVMEPVPLVESARRADREAMAREADADARSRKGFRISARDRKRIAEVEERERELAQGHAEFRFVGLVDISAPDVSALTEAAATVEQAAARSLVDLRPLEARHDRAWVACLPLGRDVTTTRGGLAP